MKDNKRYNQSKLFTGLAGTFINMFLMYFLGFKNFFNKYENSINVMTFLIYILLSFFFIWIINLCIDSFNGFYLEKKYGLSNETLLQWFQKQLKSFVVIVILRGIVFSVVYVLLKYTMNRWWILVFIFMMVFNILLGMLAPVLIFPIFYKFEELDNEELKNKIYALAAKSNVQIKDIKKFDMSKETKKANAAFTGIGKTKRIIIGDTLLNEFTEDEIIAVFAHEQGHLVNKHIIKMMIIGSFTLFISLYLISFYHFDNYYMYSNVYKIMFFLMMIQNLTMIFDNWYSRKNEKEADLYAQNILGSSKDLISALQKLEKQNLADPDPGKLIEFIFYSHPAVRTRINYLEEGK